MSCLVIKRSAMNERRRQWRNEVLRRDGYICQICGSKQRLHAHHIKSWAQFHGLRFEVSA